MARKPDKEANARLAREYHERQRNAAKKSAARKASRANRCGPVEIRRSDGTVDVQQAYSQRELLRIAPERPHIPLSLRLRIYRRDSFSCRYCGAMESLVLDHVIPVAHGGATNMGNLVSCCASCNSRKGASVWTPRDLN